MVDIDHQVSSIREWREHQKAITEEKLKSNEEIVRMEKELYESYLKKE